MLVLGSLTLDNDPYVEITYNYSTTTNGSIIGGVKNITLTGSIVADDPSDLIDKAKEINDWFGDSDRVLSSITIKGQLYPYLIIESASINDGDWVNKINYTIVLRAPIESSSILPSNGFGLSSYSDHIKSLDINESINIEADNQNTYYATNTGIATINNSVRWDIKINVSCYRTSSSSAIANAKTVLDNLIITTPNRAEFDEYKTWTMYLQSRSLSINASEGSLEFSLSALLIPPSITYDCLVSFAQSFDHNYTNNSHTRKLDINIEGLAVVNWTNPVTLLSSCYSNNDDRYERAAVLATVLYNAYKNPTADGSFLDLVLSSLTCAVSCDVIDNSQCWSPSSLTRSSSLVDGTCNLSMEWVANNSNCDNNGITTEVTLTTTTTKKAITVQTGWFTGPIIQNLGNYPAQKDYTITAKSRFSCPSSDTKIAAELEYDEIEADQPANYYKIQDTRTQDNTSYTIRVSWIQACQ